MNQTSLAQHPTDLKRKHTFSHQVKASFLPQDVTRSDNSPLLPQRITELYDPPASRHMQACRTHIRERVPLYLPLTLYSRCHTFLVFALQTEIHDSSLSLCVFLSFILNKQVGVKARRHRT